MSALPNALRDLTKPRALSPLERLAEYHIPPTVPPLRTWRTKHEAVFYQMAKIAAEQFPEGRLIWYGDPATGEFDRVEVANYEGQICIRLQIPKRSR